MSYTLFMVPPIYSTYSHRMYLLTNAKLIIYVGHPQSASRFPQTRDVAISMVSRPRICYSLDTFSATDSNYSCLTPIRQTIQERATCEPAHPSSQPPFVHAFKYPSSCSIVYSFAVFGASFNIDVATAKLECVPVRWTLCRKHMAWSHSFLYTFLSFYMRSSRAKLAIRLKYSNRGACALLSRPNIDVLVRYCNRLFLRCKLESAILKYNNNLQFRNNFV